MKISELVERKLGFAPEIVGTESSGRMRNVIEDPHCMFDSKAPQTGIRLVWPVNCCMKEHGPCHCHDRSDIPFCLAIDVMAPGGCKLQDLLVSGNPSFEVFAGEGTSIIALISFDDNTIVLSQGFKRLNSSDGFMRVQVTLELNVDPTSSGVNKD